MTDQLPKFFLGRIEEQDRFREALRAIQRESSAVEKVKDWFAEKEPVALPFIFLLYGEGGMGKTRLAERVRDIALNEDAFKGHFRAIWLDWEKRKGLDYCLAAHDAVSPETIYGHIYAVFRDEGFGREFDPYEKAVKDRAQTETKVSQAVSRASEGGDRPPAWVKLGSKGLAWLVRSGLVGGVPIPVPQEPTAQVFESIIGGGAEGLAQAHEAATTLLRSALTPDEFDLFAFPNETLARRLADGIRVSAAHKPIILTLDTYEIADNADWPWLRMVIKRAGPRVVWVIAGRDNLADSFKHGQAKGYRAEFSSERLRVLPLGEFSVGDVAAYFAGCVPQRPLDARGAEEIHRATLGIPLAVQEAAAIWATGVPLEDIVNDVPPRAARKRIVEVMTERFLMHCLKDSAYPNDRAQLYSLALAHRPDPDLLAAMLQSQDLERDLGDLERRHSFVFASEMTLHDDVAAYLRQYLLQPLRRQSVRVIHERAVAHLQDQRQAREKGASMLEDRLADERWTAATLGLAHHSFWLDEDEGWAALMPALVGGLGYDRGFARALVETAEPLQGTFTQAGQRRLKALQSGLSPRPDADAEAALLTELEAWARHWPDDGCNAERRAILDLRRGELLHHREKYSDALRVYEQVGRELLDKGIKLREQLLASLSSLGFELVGSWQWSDAAPVLRYAIELDPNNAHLHESLGHVYLHLRRDNEAIAACQRAIEIDPESASPHFILGQVHFCRDRHEEAVVAYQHAIDLYPQAAYVHYVHNALGDAYHRLGRNDEAVAAYQRAIELDPKSADAYDGLGNAYAAQGHTDEAIVEYQRANDLDPKLAYPHYNLGTLYRRLERTEDAVTECQRAIQLDPQSAESFHELGHAYSDLGLGNDAITAFQHAAELEPENASHNKCLGDVYRALGHFDSAIVVYHRAIEITPKNTMSRASLAACYRKLGRENEAAEQIKIARELMAKESEYNRACFASICGNVDEALALLKLALEKKLVSLAWARRDPDLDFIRDDPRFKAVVGATDQA